MTVSNENPVVQSRRLRVALRNARDQAKLTQAQVSESMDWSISKVIRIETGAVSVSTTDLRALLHLYGVDDDKTVDDLVQTGKASRRRAWWDEYRSLGEPLIKFIGLESSASLVRQFHSRVVPGLLQTPEYARAIVHLFQDDADTIEKQVEVRIKRQQMLDQATTNKYFFILDEGVIRRWVGGREVMLKQLDHLKEANKNPNISIQVITFNQGEYKGMNGPFSVFEFPTEDQDHVVILEIPGQSLVILEDPEKSSQYVETFLNLQQIAESSEHLDATIDRVKRDMER